MLSPEKIVSLVMIIVASISWAIGCINYKKALKYKAELESLKSKYHLELDKTLIKTHSSLMTKTTKINQSKGEDKR